MQINQGDTTPLTPAEEASLAQLAALIERVAGDGRLSRREWEDIRAKLREDGRISPQELELTNQLMDQVNQGLVVLED